MKEKNEKGKARVTKETYAMPAVQMWASWAIIHICTSNGKHLLILNCLNNALATKQLRQDDEFDF